MHTNDSGSMAGSNNERPHKRPRVEIVCPPRPASKVCPPSPDYKYVCPPSPGFVSESLSTPPPEDVVATKPNMLSKLPQELMDNITTNLGLYDLSSLSKTSKAVRQATLPTMYKDIVMGWKEHWHGPVSPPLDLLLRSVLEQPYLADFIHNINLQGRRVRHMNESELSQWRWDWETCANLFVKAALQLEFAEEFSIEDFQEDLAEYDLEAVMTLFVVKCQNLRSLRLGMDFVTFGSGPYLPAIMHALKGPILPMLKRVDLGVDRIGESGVVHKIGNRIKRIGKGFYLRELIPLLGFGAVEESEIHTLLNQDFAKSITTTNLKVLKLRFTTVNEAGLKNLLSRTPQLEQLTYHYENQRENDLGKLLNGSALTSALEEVKHTLQKLSVAICTFGQRPTTAMTGHCSFKSFPVLEHLGIQLSILLGNNALHAPSVSELLPESLRIIDFHDYPVLHNRLEYNAIVKRVFREFLEREQWRETVPYLQSMCVSDVPMKAFVEATFGEDWDSSLTDLLARFCEKTVGADSAQQLEDVGPDMIWTEFVR